jgi:hypothetical protein
MALAKTCLLIRGGGAIKRPRPPAWESRAGTQKRNLNHDLGIGKVLANDTHRSPIVTAFFQIHLSGNTISKLMPKANNQKQPNDSGWFRKDDDVALQKVEHHICDL